MNVSFTFILLQILLILSNIIYIATFQLKNNKKILIMGIVAAIIDSVVYLIFKAYLGIAVCIIAIIRNLLFMKEKNNIISLILIMILTIITFVFSFNSYFCLFNIIATLIYVYSLWQKDTKKYKLLGIIVNILMIIYNISIKSIFNVVLMGIALISSVIGYLIENKNNKLNNIKSF